jgi:hypothetical protein
VKVKTTREKTVNPFGEEPPPPLKGRHQQKMNTDSITQWAQRCIDANAICRPAGPDESTKPDSLGTRVLTEHLRQSYGNFCEQHRIRPENSDTFGKACVRMFGRKQRLTPKGWKGPRPRAYDVPEAAKWQRLLDARFGIQKATGIGWNP